MTNTRAFTLIRVVFLALLATVASAGLLSAEDLKGTFTLPLEVRWGTAVLSAGDYSFQFDKSNKIVVIRGENRAVFVPSLARSIDNHAGSSALIIVRHGRKGTVRALRLAEQNVVYFYPAPKGEPRMLAQAPELLQRIPVFVSGK